MASAVFIYEDLKSQNFQPLTYTRPVYELQCGILSLREKINLHFPKHQMLVSGNHLLKEVYNFSNLDDLNDDIDQIILINGRTIMTSELSNIMKLSSPNNKFVCKDNLIGFKIKVDDFPSYSKNSQSGFSNINLNDFSTIEVEANIAQYPWDLLELNGQEIVHDFEFLVRGYSSIQNGKIYKGAILIEENNIYIGKDAKVKPGTVIDAENGPVYIDDEAEIFPNVTIEGPCYIGKKSKVKSGAKIYENTSISKVCKIGGEIEQSIILPYTNKQHDGFLGHSYLGSWVNLGADTNNSDLKNNYGNIKLTINDEIVDSGQMFVGAIIGDHSKTAINTMLNTGTVIGVSSNVFGEGFPPKYIPSFTWGGKDNLDAYNLDKAIEVAKKVCDRRKIDFSDKDRSLFSVIFNLTSKEREKRGM